MVIDTTVQCATAGIEVISCVSHTLYDTSDVVAKNGGKAPLTYKGFEKAITALGPPPAPVEDPPAKLPPIAADSKGTDSETTSVPSLRELGYPDEASTDIKVRFLSGANCVTSFFAAASPCV